MHLSTLLFLLSTLHVYAFHWARPAGLLSNKAFTQTRSLHRLAKKDLFSDDIFADEPNEEKGSKKGSYLDEDWVLNPADEERRNEKKRERQHKELKFIDEESKKRGEFLDEDEDDEADDDEENVPEGMVRTGMGLFSLEQLRSVPQLPSWALIYEFYPRVIDANIELEVIDHEQYCEEFRRVVRTEVLNAINPESSARRRGAVIFWVGRSDDESEEEAMLAEMKRFIEKDPLVMNGYVKEWEAINLDSKLWKEAEMEADEEEEDEEVVVRTELLSPQQE